MKSMQTYSTSLDLKGTSILIVGGGPVAYQKLKGLSADAKVSLVSPVLIPACLKLARKRRAKIQRRIFRASDAKGKRLVFACTDSATVNMAVAKAAKKAGAWVCVASDPALGDFQVPAVGRVGRLSFTLSTGGASPALAKALRREWERQLRVSGVNWVLGILAKKRAWLKAHPREKKVLLRKLTSPKTVKALLEPASASRKRVLREMMATLEGRGSRV